MFEFLEKLRAKSDGTKKQVAFLSAFFIAGVIFVVWLSSVYPTFQQTNTQEANVTSQSPSPLSSFFETVSGGVSLIKSKISEVKDVVNTFATTTEKIHNASN